MFETSVRDDPHYFPSPFGGPLATGDIGFTLTVDELVAGPVVLRITGAADRRAAAPLSQCIDEVLTAKRSLVLDLLGVTEFTEVVLSIAHAAALRVSGTGAQVVAACTGTLARRLETNAPGVDCYERVADAMSAATGRPRPSSTGWIDTSEALQGRYL